ncbi:iron-containing alcohol dehydrogenase family protein [Clostridium sp. 19966]|uniref:iron-containing alcohol dehydrogenase family protein n=1 Tax=Clostridium sp. 19966 TaxID=2768166 RepID=UPI0028DFEB13|nr:iron-containing alcohol dehydrogenase family protein [Clostridium sp. 19966]MDT8717309.1 iron-containing alcohol dehydrogenase family protein [Clostridium sp. 19966]
MKANSHRISIPTILNVGKGNLENLGDLINESGFKNVALYFGEGLYELFGDIVMNSMEKNNINTVLNKEVEDINIDKIVTLAFNIPQNIDAILGIGGGKALDVAKYISFLKKLPFISVPTSTSNDGFSSSGASLLVNGKRTSVPAKMPYGIIVDIDIIKSAPEKFIYSGIGDLVSKITALYDWQFEESYGRAEVDDFAVMISKKAVNSFVRTNFNSIKDDLFLKELVDSLTMSGISMEISGDSAPSSGSEHLISHALDKICDKPQLHGIQVGIATYIMSKVQNHRYERITSIFKATGFFEYVKKLNIKKSDFEAAINLAPSIKPHRYTFIHIDEYRKKAIALLYEDEILNDILV